MKHVYFFGCSFTVGDELSDEEYLPWKFTENHTSESYYQKRDMCFIDKDAWASYIQSNKEKSYPAQIKSKYFETYNESTTGKSLRHNIFDIINLLESDSQVDALYFQIPPPGREMYVNNIAAVQSIMFSYIRKTDSYHSYLCTKAVTHDHRQHSLEDLLDLIMLKEYIKNKNVYFKFLDFFSLINLRIHDVQGLHNQNNIYISIINSAKTIPKIEFKFDLSTNLLGGHLCLKSHQIIAMTLRKDLHQNLLIK